MNKFDDLRDEVKKLHEENIRLNNWIATQEASLWRQLVYFRYSIFYNAVQ